jgi:anthranilate synthase component 1
VQERRKQLLAPAAPTYREARLAYEAAGPVAALAAMRRLHPPAMLFESGGGDGRPARFSVVTGGCAAQLLGAGSTVRLTAGAVTRTLPAASVLAACRELLACCRSDTADRRYAQFLGAYGVVSFEFAGWFENIGAPPQDGDSLPEIHLIVPQIVLVYDHAGRQATLFCLPGQGDEAELQIKLAVPQAALRAAEQTARGPAAPLKPRKALLPFPEMVREAKAAIYAGEAYQIVLSLGWTLALAGDALDAYRRLAAINPSPYMYFLDLPEGTLLGASPEMVCSLRGRRARIRPLAGTIARPAGTEAEAAAARALRRDPKERAEHVMLVDLARNDLGRVCSTGTVGVVEMFGIEHYSHVMHLVSDVAGVLAPECDAFDLFAAAFPAGTVSGAPKIRAMQLIAQLEGAPRGWYAGAVLRAGFDGSFDSCIVLRSATVRAGIAQVRAGAGIVADSVAERENRECRLKAQAIAAALGGGELQ